MDKAHKDTDRALAALERRIKKVYREAQNDLEIKLYAFMKKFKAKDEKYRQQLMGGEITPEQYMAWMRGQVFQGRQWQAKLDQITDTLVHADVVAQKIINGEVYGVFANNANWQSYVLEHTGGINFGFGLYDSSTVARLLRDQPKLLPLKQVDIPKAERWSHAKITQQITQGIIQGEGIFDIAKRLRHVTGMEQVFALTNARTAMTGAQNAGRQETLARAKGMGIKVKKEWLATLDGHTRTQHRALDGQKVDTDKPFVIGQYKIMYPGDPQAAPAMIYNCRCTMLGDLEEYPDSFNTERYDNIDGKPIKDMTYQEWYEAKTAVEKPVETVEKKQGSWIEDAPKIPPNAIFYTDWGEYTKAVNEYIEEYGRDQYDKLSPIKDPHQSVWSFGFDEDKESRKAKAIRFDNTITTLQNRYELPKNQGVVIGDYESVKTYLTDIQRSRAEGDCAGQAWRNPETNRYVIGYNITWGKSFREDLENRARKIDAGEMLLSVFENDSPEGIAIHEYGHQMADYLTNGMIHSSPNSQAYWDWYRSLSKEDIKNGLSSYAATNRGEFEAECFAELQTDDPRPLARKYWEFLKRAIEEGYNDDI